MITYNLVMATVWDLANEADLSRVPGLIEVSRRVEEDTLTLQRKCRTGNNKLNIITLSRLQSNTLWKQNRTPWSLLRGVAVKMIIFCEVWVCI